MELSERLPYLFDRYIQKKCTAEEKQQFLSLLMDPLYEEQLKEISRSYTAIDLTGMKMDEETAALAWSSIRRKAGIDTAPVWRIGASAKKWIAAAVLVLIAGGTFWLAHNRKATPDLLAAGNSVNTIVPGTTGAILTLSNGETILLDSLQNGMVANQQGMKVVLNGGQLNYEAENNEWQNTGGNQVLYNNLSTPRGRQYKVVLSDGTKVWLNAASSLKYPAYFSGRERRVEITGEAYFEVSPDKLRPFFVKINDGAAIEVIGTSFNVNAYADEPAIRTSLLSGSIRLNYNDGKTNRSFLLHPEEECVLQGDGAAIREAADIESTVAWIHGMFRFKSADIQTVMRQISRWYNVDIRYKEELDVRFSGSMYRSDNITELLKIIEFTSQVKLQISNNTIIVSSN